MNLAVEAAGLFVAASVSGSAAALRARSQNTGAGPGSLGSLNSENSG